MTEHGAVELLQEAADALGREDSSLRVGLLGGLARALDIQRPPRACGAGAGRTRWRWRAGSETAAGWRRS